MNARTPGPWRDEASLMSPGKHVVKAGVDDVVAAYANEGDGRLIAAAPELLEALCLAHDHMAGNGWEQWDGSTLPPLDLIRAAIAKATGEGE